MHLMEILKLRPVPAAAVLLGLTRRCPLTCRHCSTNSLMDSEEHAAELFLTFVDSFTAEEHPEVLLMSGGEALLRPGLVREIALRARAVGTRSHLLSGMFFAKNGRIPNSLRPAIDAVDHFAASLDIFHEEQVPRQGVLDVLRTLVDEGKDVSLQLVGLDQNDPYLTEAIADVQATLGDRVPVMVATVGASGRAADWLPAPEQAHRPLPATADPCGMAGWPLVCFDGTVLACCNQYLVDRSGAVPPHLRLGHVRTDGWPAIAARTRSSALLRTIRVVGPTAIAAGSGGSGDCGYCDTCYTLSDDPAAVAWAREMVARPSFPVLERTVRDLELEAGAQAFARRYGAARYAHLVEAGRKGEEEVTCAG